MCLAPVVKRKSLTQQTVTGDVRYLLTPLPGSRVFSHLHKHETIGSTWFSIFSSDVHTPFPGRSDRSDSLLGAPDTRRGTWWHGSCVI